MNKFKYSKISSELLNQVLITRENVTKFNIYEKFLDTSLKDSRLSNKFITFTEQLIELRVNKEKLKSIVRAYFKENKALYRQKLNHCISNGWNQEVYQILLYSVIFDEKELIGKTSLKKILQSNLDDYSKCLSIILWIKKDYAVKDLLNILENMLKDVHSTYDADKSVRMQEKYWLLRYFVYYLIDKRIIEEVDIQQHYNGNRIARDKNSIIKSELNKNYVLHKDSIKKAYVNKINEFYELLLNWGVALVQVGSDESLFEYL